MNKNVSNRRGRSHMAARIFAWVALALALGLSTETAQAQLQNLTSVHDVGQHVFYVDWYQNLHHVYCRAEFCANWTNQNLTTQTGVTVALGRFNLVSYNDTAGLHVFVVDSSGNRNLHRLDCRSNCDQGPNWADSILATNVGGGLAGYSDPYYYSGVPAEFLYYIGGSG